MKKIAISLIIIVVTINTYAQQIPNSFLGIKLGITKDEFIKNNPDTTKGSFWVLMTDISAYKTDVLNIVKQTSSGDKVDIDCCFKNNKLVIISIEYKGYQSEDEILSGLKTKYGNYTTRVTQKWKDFMNGQYRTTNITRWTLNKTCLLELDHTKELGLTELIIADKATQKAIALDKKNESKKKVE